ncbi:hypothetical protein B0T17DRAFT_658867 [Bombardia bombarda]|uniref:Cupin type-1 domain-containing protein n=1 Tax=Bombardia bombarda TaxID=252184 RepID=A0AA39U285_9PEZI|nr:hypothetical protein B0T17DRAFT_658867 [Bombardia bombarda]
MIKSASVNEDGQSFTDDLCAGDVWFFPTGVPHNIQALDEGGDFSAYGTFLVSELSERNPIEVLSKDLEADVSAFDDLPHGELYIFNGTPDEWAFFVQGSARVTVFAAPAQSRTFDDVPKEKPIILAGNRNLTALAGNGTAYAT